MITYPEIYQMLMKTTIYVASFLTLLLSVFFTTFESSNLQNVPKVSFPGSPLAQRVVLIVIDGLGQHILREGGITAMPFLMNISRSLGTVGLARARAPTESRTRHVAMLAGFEEDLACIKNGWSSNTEPFDSILHQTQYTWACGDPIVIKQFQKSYPAANSRVEYDHYSENAFHSISFADNYVFEMFIEFIERNITAFVVDSKTESGLDESDRRRGKLLFLHLCSVDDAGHRGGYRNPLQLTTVRTADNIVAQVHAKLAEKLTRAQFESTAFIVTADHGTKQNGGHGGGTPDEIYVPIFLWGSGLTRLPSVNNTHEQSPIQEYKILTDQVNICNLIASLLGTVIPSNARGILPDHLLSANESIKAQLLASNAKHLQNLIYAMQKKSYFITGLPFAWRGSTVYTNKTSDLKTLLKLQLRLKETLDSSFWHSWRISFVIWAFSITLFSINWIIAAIPNEWSITRNLHKNNTLYQKVIFFTMAFSILVVFFRGCSQVATFHELLLLPLLCMVILTIFDEKTILLRSWIQSVCCISWKKLNLINVDYFQFMLLSIETCLTIQAYYQKELYSISIILVVVSSLANKNISKQSTLSCFWFLLSFLLATWNLIFEITTSPFIERYSKMLGLFLLLINQIVFHFLPKKRENFISMPDFVLNEFFIIAVHLMCLNIYIDRFEVFLTFAHMFSFDVIKYLRSNFGYTCITAVCLCLLIFSYFVMVCKHGGSKPSIHAILWLIHLPITFLMGAANLLETGSWAEILSSLAYFFYLSFLPPLFALCLLCFRSKKRVLNIMSP